MQSTAVLIITALKPLGILAHALFTCPLNVYSDNDPIIGVDQSAKPEN